jgi:hypothetical protein
MSNLSGDREILEIPAAKKRKLQSPTAEKEVQNGDNTAPGEFGKQALTEMAAFEIFFLLPICIFFHYCLTLNLVAFLLTRFRFHFILYIVSLEY